MDVSGVKFPEKLQMLFQPSRFKVMHGGRGGAKSWGVARALLLMARAKSLRVLCARETQKSISESVHLLLKTQIAEIDKIAPGFADGWVIEKAYIKFPHPDGSMSTFAFEGIKNDPQKIKSYEGVDICWVEEAQSVTKESWDILIPTIRKEEKDDQGNVVSQSEIWITFNPGLKTDETYKRFVLSPPKKAVVVAINWRDNPWFPDVLMDEMLECKAKDFDSYLHVWEGKCKENLEGAVFAKQLRAASAEDRFMVVPYERSKPVYTFWDLGKGDGTAIWFAQMVGFQYRVLDFYENRQEDLDHYIKILQRKPYTYDVHWLPHDAKHKRMGMKRTIAQQLEDTGAKVNIVPKLRKFDQIEAARSIFPLCFFDERRCEAGIDHLRNYRFAVDQSTGQFSNEPVHDEHSHAADAFMGLALALKEPRSKDSHRMKGARRLLTEHSRPGLDSSGLGWMG